MAEGAIDPEHDIAGSVMKPEPNKSTTRVCQLKITCSTSEYTSRSSTGFLCEITLNGNLLYGLFTNNHSLGEKELRGDGDHLKSFEMLFEFGGKTESAGLKIEEFFSQSPFRFTCPVLDVTFVQFSDEVIQKISEKKYVHYFSAERVVESVDGVPVKIIGHPGKHYGGKRHSAEGVIHSRTPFRMLHQVTTEKGSSGSPVVKDGKVIAIHSAGIQNENFNLATPIDSVLNAMERVYAGGSKFVCTPSEEHLQEVKQMHMKSRLNVSGIRVYSYYTAAANQQNETWFLLTSHGWYWTKLNPCDVDLKDMFLEIDWLPLEDMFDQEVERCDMDTCQLAKKLQNLKL